ncbi:MAG: hypothetical protein WEA77_00215 [Hyphomonas sp.]|uniref:hypothetical protein n=1 Tax=Hyphomonas sp. TaxID=87 RepID=UPI0034A03079
MAKVAASPEALRAILLGLKAPKLDEPVKWSAPSYAVGGAHCVTFNFGDLKSIRLIFHCDTMRKETKGALPAFDDALLAWQSGIRAIEVLRNMEEIAAAKKVLAGFLKRWVREVLEA